MQKMQKMQFWSPGLKDPLEEEMATCSSIIAWKIPWNEEPRRLQSIGLQRVRQAWVSTTIIATKVWLKV